MDAVEFLEQLKKRSKSNPDYYGEELNIAHIEPISLVSKVEQWAKEHPVKTRQSVFLEQWPEALFREGILQICPASVSHGFRGKIGECVVEPKDCQKCKRQFWLEEVEE